MTADPTEIERAFADEGPWQSHFTIDGHAYGGECAVSADGERVEEFFEWVGSTGERARLGWLKGAHSAQLAAAPSVERLVCLEARADSVLRARTAIAALGFSERVQVGEQLDLEDADLSAFGTFDAAFCAGLLYHLSRPWLLLRELRRRVGVLFLDTHVSPTDHIVLAGYRGSMYRELGIDDALSGVLDHSFWPTAEALDEMLARCRLRRHPQARTARLAERAAGVPVVRGDTTAVRAGGDAASDAQQTG